ncbi:glutathione S-transferase [Violaceomyces palustris]|uniref:Glutathione S-transferase n=1 Tax=Violaceomyces palustris TaxID=1673888 RepID=A0ACD0P8H0_9BASI|nr:glutathione S-transferase [Violaceomyces palustris]
MSSQTNAAPKPGAKGANYHKECTGQALETVKAHSRPVGVTLFGAAFCPFVHRVWIAFEFMGIPYQYREVDPYAKPADLLELNPKGLVPALRLEDGKGLGESTVILEYLEEAFSLASEGKVPSLLPPLSDAYGRALSRLACDKINRNLVPAFYRYLQAQEPEAQARGAKEFLSALEGFTDEMDPKGPFWGGEKLGLPDVMAAPWCFRANCVLRHFRGFEIESMLQGTRYGQWQEAVFSHPAFKATTSTEELYLDSYARYAENRPNTSQVANAINSGRGLP